MAYFSNGSEGMALEAQCAECPLGDGPCPVYGAQMVFNYEQVGNDLAERIMDNYIGSDSQCRLRPLVAALRENSVPDGTQPEEVKP